MSEDREVSRVDTEGAGQSAPSVDFADPEISSALETLADSLQTIVGISFSGPMPPPALFEEYEAILPGTALVIRDSWVNQQEHRRKMEERDMVLREEAQDASIGLSSRGQIIAAVLGVGIIALGFYMVYMGAFGQAAAIAIGSLVAFAIAFYTGHLPWHRKDK